VLLASQKMVSPTAAYNHAEVLYCGGATSPEAVLFTEGIAGRRGPYIPPSMPNRPRRVRHARRRQPMTFYRMPPVVRTMKHDYVVGGKPRGASSGGMRDATE